MTRIGSLAVWVLTLRSSSLSSAFTVSRSTTATTATTTQNAFGIAQPRDVRTVPSRGVVGSMRMSDGEGEDEEDDDDDDDDDNIVMNKFSR